MSDDGGDLIRAAMALDPEMAHEMERVFGRMAEDPKEAPEPKLFKRRKAETEAPPRDMVNLPHHYARYPIEPMRFLGENRADLFQFNIVKYAMRHDAKNGLEDLLKVLRGAEMYIKFTYLKDPDWWGPSTVTFNGGPATLEALNKGSRWPL